MYTPTRGAPGDSASPFRTPVRHPAGAHPESHSLDSPASQPPPKGNWFNPDAQRVLDDRVLHLSERQSTMRLRWNVASLIVLAWCLQTGMYRFIKSAGLAAGFPSLAWVLLEWLGLAVLVFNTGEAVWYLLMPQNQYTNLAMTPSQRLRIGLDSRVKSTTRNTPISPPNMTPSKSPFSKQQTLASVTDIESRRKTPVKGGGSVLTTPGGGGGGGSSTTPRLMRSPVLLAAGQAEYSTDCDLPTLLQVLKKVPGSSSLTDNPLLSPTRLDAGGGGGFALETPPMISAYGDASMATPRLPVSRYSINDMPISTPMQQHLRAQPTIGLYQTATPVSRASGSEGAKGSSKDRASGDVDYLEPHEVLERYGVERDILDWVDNMHMWFVRHLLRPLCKQIDELDSLFEQHGLGHLSCKRAVLDTAALEQSKASGASTFGAFGTSSLTQNASATPQTLVDLALKYGELPQTKERMALEKYLRIPGYLCRDYIVQRVHTLAQSGTLPAYTFDGGGSYVPSEGSSFAAITAQEQPWNPVTHPTDGQLLFHLFCTFMDQTMPPVQNSRHAFTDRYVLQPERKPDHNLPVQIIQVVRKRPHFCLMVKGSFYDVTANRNNLFITLILFVLEIQRECAGYLGLTNLGGKHVDLLSVVNK
ncbi:hypothetical protein IWW38_002484 [Coemansia aciculifera]|uniref:Uncharacterized protein n=1 Tax=Coemansia aciculifera TaxID=417176 RepID=A0ACC1M3Y4_9FUNG|nr:hypothetical protein IWW38_002484 [Coemansia aciculifera]